MIRGVRCTVEDVFYEILNKGRPRFVIIIENCGIDYVLGRVFRWRVFSLI